MLLVHCAGMSRCPWEGEQLRYVACVQSAGPAFQSLGPSRRDVIAVGEPSEGKCTIHTMLKEFELKDPILQRIARIVDEADVVQEVMPESVAPGLDTICQSIRLTSHDDYVALERGALIYEALYPQLMEE